MWTGEIKFLHGIKINIFFNNEIFRNWVVNIGVHDSFIIIIIIILIVPMNALFYLLLYYINGARASEPGSKEMGIRFLVEGY